MAEPSSKARASAAQMVAAVKDYVARALVANLSPVNAKVAALERRLLALETRLDEREKAKTYAIR